MTGENMTSVVRIYNSSLKKKAMDKCGFSYFVSSRNALNWVDAWLSHPMSTLTFLTFVSTF